MSLLTPLEQDVLVALSDGRWRTVTEIVERSGQATFAVRGAVAELRRRRLVQRGHDRNRVGTFSLTPSGHVEVAHHTQLRLV
jgi:DNA-binding IclR family transcriptional regulator